MAMLPAPPTKPCPKTFFFTPLKQGSKKEEYAKPPTEGRELSYGKIGLTTVTVTQNLLSGMPLFLKIELILLWNSILLQPGQPSAQLSELIRLMQEGHSCNKPVI